MASSVPPDSQRRAQRTAEIEEIKAARRLEARQLKDLAPSGSEPHFTSEDEGPDVDADQDPDMDPDQDADPESEEGVGTDEDGLERARRKAGRRDRRHVRLSLAAKAALGSPRRGLGVGAWWDEGRVGAGAWREPEGDSDGEVGRAAAPAAAAAAAAVVTRRVRVRRARPPGLADLDSPGGR
jgi:hypothetical protein